MEIERLLLPGTLATALTVLLGLLAAATTANGKPALVVPDADTKPIALYGAPIPLGTFASRCRNEPRESAPEPQLTLPCQTYVIAFLESSGLLEYETKTGPRYCLPVEVSPGELVAMMVEAGDRPELKEFPVAMILRGTLETQFPCPPEMKRPE